jgi:hypothetical protein
VNDISILSIILNLFIYIIFILLNILLFYGNIYNNKKIYNIILILLISIIWNIGSNYRFNYAIVPTLGADYKIVFISLIMIYLGLTENKRLLIVVASLLLAVASLIKFTAFFMSLALIISLTIIQLIFNYKNKKVESIILAPLTYTLSLIILWITIHRDITKLFPFLKWGIAISSDYNTAMALDGPLWQIYLALAMLIFLLFLSIYSKKHKDFYLSCYLFLSLPLLLISFRHAFGRHDVWHGLTFFIVLTTVLSHISALTNDKASSRMHRLVVVVLITTICATIISAKPILEKSSIDMQSKIDTINFILNPKFREEYIHLEKLKFKNYFKIDTETLETIGKSSVDVIPWDFGLIWAYNLNWSSKPVIQTFIAYNKLLDDLNSRHYMQSNSPDYIFFSYKSIDGRYPFFDNPKTFRVIQNKYRYIKTDGEFIILKKCKSNFNENLTLIKVTRAKFNEWIAIPKSEGYIYGFVYIDYSTLGLFKKMIFKASKVYVQFRFVDGSVSKMYRVIPDLLKNGILLNQYVETTYDLRLIYSGFKTADITHIKFYSENPDDYNNQILVVFMTAKDENLVRYNRLPMISKLKLIKFNKNQKCIFLIGCVNGECRRVIYQHPLPNQPSVISFERVNIPENSTLVFGIALNPYTWNKDGDGVKFEIEIKDIKKGSSKIIFSRYIDPKHNRSERKWNDFKIKLSEFSNKTVDIIFKTYPCNNSKYDWAWWSEPILIYYKR